MFVPHFSRHGSHVVATKSRNAIGSVEQDNSSKVSLTNFHIISNIILSKNNNFGKTK